jgi:outer membrane protein assembly factor BamE (lipoprotein component of BamABCDE complex)
MTSVSRVPALAALVLALAGCADLNVGRPIDRAKLATIVPGRSTKDSVRGTFGIPLHAVSGPDGEIWVYRHLDGERAQELSVSFAGDRVSVFSSE